MGERLRTRRALFRERVEEAVKALPECESLAAVAAFLRRDPPAKIEHLLRTPTDLKPEQLSAALFAFKYEPDGGECCVHDDPRIRAYFRALLESPGEKLRGQCLVTGERDVPLARLHAKPKGIPPIATTKGGVPLTTVNQESFRSYGLDAMGGAPISESANLAIDTALTRLLAPAYPGPDGTPLPKRHFVIGSDSVLVYWTRQETSLDFFSGLEERDPEEVAQLLRSPQRSFAPPLEDPTDFYALILSGKQGRAVVRSFVETTVQEVARNVERHREESRIERPYGKGVGGFSLGDLRRALAARGDTDNLPPSFGTALYLAVILGRALPRGILETVVRRNRVELLPSEGGRRGRSSKADPWPLAARTSLLKAWFIRNRVKEIPVALDKQRTEVAYRLGRLLATLDKVQEDALGSVNASIVDRFYGSASSIPAAVFPTLIRRSKYHIGRLRRDNPGLAVVREKLIQDIYSTIEGFPKTLGLEDQGLFSIGFYHQRQDFFTKKKEEV